MLARGAGLWRSSHGAKSPKEGAGRSDHKQPKPGWAGPSGRPQDRRGRSRQWPARIGRALPNPRWPRSRAAEPTKHAVWPPAGARSQHHLGSSFRSARGHHARKLDDITEFIDSLSRDSTLAGPHQNRRRQGRYTARPSTGWRPSDRICLACNGRRLNHSDCRDPSPGHSCAVGRDELK